MLLQKEIAIEAIKFSIDIALPHLTHELESCLELIGQGLGDKPDDID